MTGCGGKFTISAVGVGCWSMGSADGEYWGERKQEDTNAIVKAALTFGNVYLDTAEVYNAGRSEEALGAALKAAHPDDAARAVIGSKILPNNCHDVRGHLEATLARLQCAKIDLYQVHWPLNEKTCCVAMKSKFHNQDAAEGGVPDVGKVFAELAALQAEGKIGHIGVSNFGVKQLTEALATGATIATNQLVYNLGSRMIEHEVLPLCAANGIGVIAYSPLMQGVLTDKGVASASFDEFARRIFFAERVPADYIESKLKPDTAWMLICRSVLRDPTFDRT